MPDSSLVLDLTQDDLVARHGREVLAIRSIETDTAARRIVLVAENEKRLSPAARQVEVGILGTILNHARAEDSFAFLTAQGPRQELRFGTPREALASAIGELSTRASGKDRGLPTLDAVLEAANWLQPPQRGDSVVLLTLGLGIDDPAYGRVEKALTNAGQRLFGFQVGRILAGIYGVGLVPGPNGAMVPTATIEPNRHTAFDLSDETGGFFFEEDTEGNPRRTYRLTAGRLRFLEGYGLQLYKGIVECYRIRLEALPGHFTIDLNESLRQKLPKARVLYPRGLKPCS